MNIFNIRCVANTNGAARCLPAKTFSAAAENRTFLPSTDQKLDRMQTGMTTEHQDYEHLPRNLVEATTTIGCSSPP
jgi:hypothetical protein